MSTKSVGAWKIVLPEFNVEQGDLVLTPAQNPAIMVKRPKIVMMDLLVKAGGFRNRCFTFDRNAWGLDEDDNTYSGKYLIGQLRIHTNRKGPLRIWRFIKPKISPMNLHFSKPLPLP